jgi:hypothetical protein
VLVSGSRVSQSHLTNAFSKKIENHAHAVALFAMYYNSSASIRRCG